MNQVRDAMLVSIWDTDDVKGSGDNYGTDIVLDEDDRFLDAQVQARIFIDTAFTSGAIVVTLTVCSGSTAAPTDIIHTFFTGAASGGPAAGTSLTYTFEKGELDAFTRFNVNLSGAIAAGAVTAEIYPITS
jgi:hypothetical protein